MGGPLIHIFVISTWVASCMGAQCYWLGIPWCGLVSSCGKDHYMWPGFSKGSCVLQPTKFCCPGSDGHDVVLCEHDRFNGECIVTSLANGQACANVEKNDWASSVNTLGKCIRLYDHANCEGKSKAFYPGSPGHDNLWEMNDIVTSVGRCFDHDEPREGCNRAKRQLGPGKCEFAADLLTIGFLAWRARQTNPNQNGAMRWFQTGHNDRVESMEAIIEQRHLNSGSPTNQMTRDWAHMMGRSNDDAGHILAQRLGGSGGDINNIFPQSPNINRGVWAQAEAAVADAVTRRGRVRYNVNLEYRGPYDTRPYKIVFRVADANTGKVIFDVNDLVNP